MVVKRKKSGEKRNKLFIHPAAIVESDNIGDGSRVWAYAHILPNAKIGKYVNVCDQCFIENDVIIGDDVTIKCGVYLWDGIEIGDKVFIGPAAVFTNDLNPRSKNRNYKLKKTFLLEGCSIGANATILAGITIGRYSLVGAGSVVTKDVPDYALVYGNPARQNGFVCRCGQKLKFINNNAICGCGFKYKISKNQVSRAV